jgi:hypothetical protein
MTPPAANTAAFAQEQIVALGETMQRGFDKIENLLYGMDARVRAIETSQAGSYPLIESRVNAAWRELDSLKSEGVERQKCITDLEKKVSTMYTILKWLAGSLGGLAVALLWQILTGQIMLVR